MFTPKVIKKVAKAELIGRGCNVFPTAKKWQMVRAAKGRKKYVVCNVSESEPGVFKDFYILQNWPERVIDGLILAIKAVKAVKGFMYLNPEYYHQFQERLLQIISQHKLNIELYQKPLHDYVGGEETALLNSMQGLRVEPRLKPPYPTNRGLFNQPTLVNNCETLYMVSLINSGDYKQTRFYCLSGDRQGIDDIFSRNNVLKDRVSPKTNEVRSVSTPDGRSGLIKELPINITVKKCLREFGHIAGEKYFYQIGGGAAGKCYNHKQLNRKFDGLASIIIYRADRSEKEIVMQWLDFFKNESCGRCVPCREGTYRLRNLMEEYYLSHKTIDQQVLGDLIFSLQNTSFCPLGRVSANALLSYWQNVKQAASNNN